jgi:antirestriction protein
MLQDMIMSWTAGALYMMYVMTCVLTKQMQPNHGVYLDASMAAKEEVKLRLMADLQHVAVRNISFTRVKPKCTRQCQNLHGSMFQLPSTEI